MSDPEPAVTTLHAEWLKSIERSWKMLELVSRPQDVPIGQTPKVEVYRRRKARLYRYHGGHARHRTPILLVPNLGMARPDIFDLLPGASLVEFMLAQGFDFYLLDWGVFDEEDRDLTLVESVENTLPRVIRHACRTSGSAGVSLLAYCLGATLSACHLALDPATPVRSLVSLAGPIDFSRGGAFRLWLDPRYFDADRFVDVCGTVPPWFFAFAFGMLRPMASLAAASSLWEKAEDQAAVTRHQALGQWANTYSPMPGEFFRTWVKEFYQENRLVRGELRLGGRPVDLGRIRCPVLTVVGQEDNVIPPDEARALVERVGSEVKQLLELPGGHASLIIGRQASTRLWPALAEWFGRHDEHANAG